MQSGFFPPPARIEKLILLNYGFCKNNCHPLDTKTSQLIKLQYDIYFAR